MDAAFARVHGVGATSGNLRQWNGEKVDGAQSLVVQRVLHQAPMTSTLRSSTKLLSGPGQTIPWSHLSCCYCSNHHPDIIHGVSSSSRVLCCVGVGL